MEYRIVAQDGRIIWVRDEAILVLDDAGKPHHWQGLLINMTEQKQAEEALRRRDAIMEAISLAAEKFLVVSWQENIQTILGQLGRAAGVSRAYIFQNRISGGRTVSDQIYEWAAPGIKPQLTNREMTGFDFEEAGFERWIPFMSEGQPIFGVVKEMNPGEKRVFNSQGILSIACMPIFVNKAWWGFIGFDDCAEERNWRSAEIDALKTSANIIGAAIQRLGSEYALQRQLNELTVLQSVSAAGMQSNKVDDLISITTQILGNLLYPENCGVYLYDQVTSKLTPHHSYHSANKLLDPDSIPASQGVVGVVFTKNKPLLFPDATTSQVDTPINPEIKSEMAVPLRIGERPIGVLNVQSQQSTPYAEDDLHLLTTIAGQLSIAIEKIHLLENDHRRLQESETLRQAASVISTSLDLELVLDTILSSVKKVVPYDSACIFLSENESPALHVVAAQGFADNSKILQKTFQEPGRLLREVFEKRQIVIIDDVQIDDRFEIWEP